MPSPINHSTLSNLTKLFLKSLDEYSSTDLEISTETTDRNTTGEVARICLNLGLKTIYSLIKDSKYLAAFPTTSFSTVPGQDYIDLDQEATLDEIECITDTANQLKLIQKTWRWYRANYPNPSNATGSPVFYYIRRNNRVYFAPRPSTAIQLTIDFRKFTGDLKLSGDLPLIPTQYDSWIVAEASVLWFKMQDAQSIPPLVISERDDIRKNSLYSILSDYDSSLQTGSAMDRRVRRVGAWDRL